MRTIFLPLFFLAVSPFAAIAQTPGRQHCTVHPAAALTDADTAFIAGNAASAESLWNAKITASPSTAAYAGLIRSQLQQNKLDPALASSKLMITAFPDAVDSYTTAADVLFRLGHIPEAGNAVAKALSLDQCAPRAHFDWGRLNGLLAHHDIEVRELTAAHALAPSDPEITAAWIELRPRVERAALLATLLASHPNLPPDTVIRLTTEQALLDQKKFCTPAAEIANAKLNMEPVPYLGRGTRSWSFKTSVNGSSLGLVELDTSVSGIVLNPSDAQKAGVHHIGPVPASPTAVYTAYADRIRIGDVEYHDCPVRVAPKQAVAEANSIIGPDFFRDNVIHIDYVAQTLSLTPLPPLTPIPANLNQTSDWTPVYVTGSTLLVPTLIDKKGPFLFLLDTGSYSSILSPAIVSRLLDVSHDQTIDRLGYSGEFIKIKPHEGGINTDRADIYGPDGKLLPVVRPVKLPTFRFAKSEIADTSVLSFDFTPISHEAGIEVTGLIGFRLLQQFSIDLNYRDGLARIVFDQNRRYAQRQADKQF